MYIREMPPGLLQHVLTVLVFWAWVLFLPRLPPRSRSLRLFPWASILLHGPLDIAWICCPQLPHHPCKNGTHSTCFYSTGGHTQRKTKGQQLKGKIVSRHFFTLFGTFPHIFTPFQSFSEFFLQDFFLELRGFTAVLAQR